MKYIVILFLLSTLLLSSCIKDLIKPKEYTIKGYLYKDCSGMPAKNQCIDMFNDKAPSIFGNDVETQAILGYTYTDSNGYFSLTYKTKEYGSRNGLLRADANSGTYLAKEVILGKIDNINALYLLPSCSMKIYLKVINPLTINDTLFINGYKAFYINKKFIGPFSSGEISNINYHLFDYSISSKDSTGISYKMGNNGIWKNKATYIDPCKSYTDTIIIQ